MVENDGGFRRISGSRSWVYGTDNSGNRLSPSGSSLAAGKLTFWQDYDLFSEFPGAKGFPRVLGKNHSKDPCSQLPLRTRN